VPTDLGDIEGVSPARDALGLLELDVLENDDAPPVPARALHFVFVTHRIGLPQRAKLAHRGDTVAA